MQLRILPPIAVLLLAACSSGSAGGGFAYAPAPAPALAPTDAASLVRAMRDRYAGRWYHTVTFTQRTSRVLPNDSVVRETWYEWIAIPGRLRIQLGAAAEGRGQIYARDSIYVIRSGMALRSTAGRNPLLLLGFDVYAQPPERTLEMLRQEGFALDRFHADTLGGRPVWVVGAGAGDLRAKQFWVEQDRLLFLRLLEPAGADTTRIQDIRFASYAPLGRAWIAPLVEVWAGGKRVFWEEYTNVRADVPLDSVFFQPNRWNDALQTAR